MKLLDNLRIKSYKGDIELFCSFLEYNPEARLLDIGCGDGIKTEMFAESIGTKNVGGIDIKDFGVSFELVKADIEDGLPFGNEQYDVVTSSHIIEHISNTDLFIKEITRILSPGGYALIATPNLACGRVILELLLNKQPNITHTSDLFIPRGDPGECWRDSVGYLHKRLFTVEGLKRLLTYHGLKVEYTKETGYGPFPFLNIILRGRYASNLIVKARKC